MRASRSTFIALAITLITGVFAHRVGAQDPTEDAAAKVNEKFGGNVKRLFSTKCSWCHQAYGMKQADGPKLAGTGKTLEQVISQIKNGKSPMPGFKTQLKDEEVQALAEYIKALPAN